MGNVAHSIPNRLPLSAWQTESLRLTLFHSQTMKGEYPTWWKDLTGRSPELTLSGSKVGGRREIGKYEEGNLVLAFQPGRIDWRLTVDPEKESTPEGLMSIGDFPASLSKFRDIMSRWFALGDCPPAERLAFGAIVLYPVEGRKEGYWQLSPYMHKVEMAPEDSSDLFYQINRPRPSESGVPGLRINRLSKWSVATLNTIAGSLPMMRPFLETQGFACRLEVDVNTVPIPELKLTPEQLPTVFSELVELGEEIMRQGDIP